jgi:hypothetical protein
MRRRAAQWNLLILSGLIVCPSGVCTVYFSENFDSYASTAALTAGGWALENTQQIFNTEGDTQGGGANGGFLLENANWYLAAEVNYPNPPTRNGSKTTGQKILSDSAASPNNDSGDYLSGYAITTPAFNCATAAQVILHLSLDALLNNVSGSVFEIYAFNGTQWSLVFTRISPERQSILWPPGDTHVATSANADGFYGVLDLDLTSAAAGHSQVQLRFINRGNSDDWWIQIDDILVDDQEYGVAETVGLFGPEDFAGPLGSLPAGWSRTTQCGDNPWQVGDLSRHYSLAPGGIGSYASGRGVHRLDTTYAILDSDKDPDTCPDNEVLESPLIDCSGYSQIFLHFDSETVPQGTSLRVELTANGGGSWAEVWTYDNREPNGFGEEPCFASHILPLPGAGAASQVRVRFVYEGTGHTGFWAIDKVALRGRQAIPADPSASVRAWDLYE